MSDFFYGVPFNAKLPPCRWLSLWRCRRCRRRPARSSPSWCTSCWGHPRLRWTATALGSPRPSFSSMAIIFSPAVVNIHVILCITLQGSLKLFFYRFIQSLRKLFNKRRATLPSSFPWSGLLVCCCCYCCCSYSPPQARSRLSSAAPDIILHDQLGWEIIKEKKTLVHVQEKTISFKKTRSRPRKRSRKKRQNFLFFLDAFLVKSVFS